jgi:hypothetical protein
MSARTDALVSQQETGKITASIVLRCGRLPPSMSDRFNADSEIMFRVETDFLGVAQDIELTAVVAAAAAHGSRRSSPEQMAVRPSGGRGSGW